MSNEKLKRLIYLNHLLSIEGIGPLKVFSILSKLDTIEKITSANINNLSEIEGINKTLASKILRSIEFIQQSEKKVELIIDSLLRINANIITYWDDEYPELLKRIYYPPIILYTLGKFSINDINSVAIVGTRQPTNYGKLSAEKFSIELAKNNITIVSGLARGIDSVAHQAALKAGGRTIAVVGSGLDVIYPPENKKLFDEIKEKGIIISEYELGTKPDAQNFPKRNRIISGLSLGSIIIETKLNGGAMQTAAYAIDQNREVFAVPGNINSKNSEGPNTLIQRGEAKLILNSEDVLLELKMKIKPEIGINIPKPSIELSLFEEKIFAVLNNQPMHIDEISCITCMSVADCLVNLLMLEFKDLVKQLPGKMFIKC